MLYESTRGNSENILSSQAIKNGIAQDGGLYVPESYVSISLDKINELSRMNYNQRAITILKDYLTDFTDEEITQCVNCAYTTQKFSDEKIAPLKSLNKYIKVLELWHGPTCAFKDMALQILPHLLVKSIHKTGEDKEVVILVATSGDTGKAALEGCKDVPGTGVIVFFPQEGVSEVQRLQMITQNSLFHLVHYYSLYL